MATRSQLSQQQTSDIKASELTYPPVVTMKMFQWTTDLLGSGKYNSTVSPEASDHDVFDNISTDHNTTKTFLNSMSGRKEIYSSLTANSADWIE